MRNFKLIIIAMFLAMALGLSLPMLVQADDGDEVVPLITSAIPDLEAEPPLIIIKGSNFGRRPTVFMGSPDGGYDQLFIVSSSHFNITAELETVIPGTYLLNVSRRRGNDRRKTWGYVTIPAEGIVTGNYSQTIEYYHPISTDLSAPTQLLSSTITCPAAGYIAAHAKANAELFAGSTDPKVVPHVNISLNTTNTFNDDIQTWAGNRQGSNSTYNSHIGYLSMSLDWVWSCSSGQILTIYMTGFTYWSGDKTRILKPTLILYYFSSE